MAKSKKVRRKRKKIGHVRLNCPHCGRDVTVQRPSAFQRTMPCPNCRIPIASGLIIATSEGDVAPVQEESSEESVTEEAAATSA
jgi:ribosomal protein S27E